MMKFNFSTKKPLGIEDLKEKYAQTPSQFLKLNNLEVHYRDEGIADDKTPLVLLHGFGAHLYTFNSWVDRLSSEFRIIRLDLPGFGLTGAFPDADYSTNRYTSFLKQFLTELGVEKCIIGGNSMGGNIAWNFALDYPNMVEKLVLINAAGCRITNKKLLMLTHLARIPKIDYMIRNYAPSSVFKRTVQEVYANRDRIHSKTVDRYIDLIKREGNTKAMVDISKTLEFVKDKVDPRIDEISKIKQPILILWGQRDNVLPVADAKQFYKNTPNSKLVIFDEAGHVPMEEIPKTSVEPLKQFLSE
ncbi:alpha/beta hydrolase [Weeksellaceae bacterium KMM 9713]|uniref:Alpha/beta hydrolase n=1 Tax=Profundicola chukchiensis TaxID=2961959 RepID=A0A9X4MVR9_9FLAO|nr:alpha/beta hydrolase [Profundicola chukchiensis]MDG4944973.1 alpha/beta hydrolase [Profundicola chukchiensis]